MCSLNNQYLINQQSRLFKMQIKESFEIYFDVGKGMEQFKNCVHFPTKVLVFLCTGTSSTISVICVSS